MKITLLVATSAVLSAVVACPEEIPLNDPSRLELIGTRAEMTTYRGATALRVTGKEMESGDALVLIKNSQFQNGAIELDLAGAPMRAAGEQARGFIGVAFRAKSGASHFELIYVRPTNGRADDQLRRNHSTQYVSFPDWPWERLRKENPGVYESYADMVAGAWMHVRIEVKRTAAFLYVGLAAQPCLVVHDLKLGDSQGAVALWIGPGTEGYFRNLKIVSEK